MEAAFAMHKPGALRRKRRHLHPTRHRLPFKANPVLSGRRMSHLSGKGQDIVFYEAVPAPDGSRAIYQFNGRVTRVAPKEWAKLAKLSGLGS